MLESPKPLLRGQTAADLDAVARRLFWWLPPEDALKDGNRFLAQVMALGTERDVAVAQKAFTRDAWKQALRHAPPGVIDARSWHYWHHILGMHPVPPLPERKLGL